jgi:pimeloyl-ACP methyl ester carboxylesterase
MSREEFNKLGLHWVGGASKGAATSHVVFVHGLDGKGFDTWAQRVGDESTFWPQWLESEGSGLAIWTYAYDAASTLWKGKPDALEPTAKKFLQHLEAESVSKAPTVLVTHSLGGLVSKALLRTLADTKHSAFPNFRGIAFFGTPHIGSPLGSELNSRVSGAIGFVARKSALAELLGFSRPELLSLNTWFQNHWPPKPVRVYFEDEPMLVAGGAINLGHVVPQGTADPGVPGNFAFPIGADHSEMCKFASPDSINYRHVAAFIREALDSKAATQIPTIKYEVDRTCFFIPSASLGDKFIGRDEDLQNLHDQLTALDGKTIALAVQGIGGQGKTQLAVEYAYRYCEHYKAVIWMSADSPPQIEKSLAELCEAHKLDLPEKVSLEIEARISGALRWLREHSNWLLVLDNVDGDEAKNAVLKRFQGVGGKILITCQPPSFVGRVATFELAKLSLAASEKLLRECSPHRTASVSDDNIDCSEIAKELDGMAFALKLAAAFIDTRRISFARYLDEWRGAGKQDMLAWQNARETGYPRRMATTWRLSMDRLSIDGQNMLTAIAFLAPNPLPDVLWDSNFSELQFLFSGNARDVRYELLSNGLLESSNAGYQMHRLIAAAVLDGLSPPNEVAHLKRAWGWIGVFTKHTDETDYRNDVLYHAMWPHLQKLTERFNEVDKTRYDGQFNDYMTRAYATFCSFWCRVNPYLGIQIANYLLENVARNISLKNLIPNLLSDRAFANVGMGRRDLAVADYDKAIELFSAKPVVDVLRVAIEIDVRSHCFFATPVDRTRAISEKRLALSMCDSILNDPIYSKADVASHRGKIASNLASALELESSLSSSDNSVFDDEILELRKVALESAKEAQGIGSPDAFYTEHKLILFECKSESKVDVINSRFESLYLRYPKVENTHPDWITEAVISQMSAISKLGSRAEAKSLGLLRLEKIVARAYSDCKLSHGIAMLIYCVGSLAGKETQNEAEGKLADYELTKNTSAKLPEEMRELFWKIISEFEYKKVKLK